MAIHAFFTLDSYIYGFAVQEHNLPSGTPEQLADLADTMLKVLPPAEYPYLHIVDYVLTSGFDYAKEFEFGLNLVLDASRGPGTRPDAGGRPQQRKRTFGPHGVRASKRPNASATQLV